MALKMIDRDEFAQYIAQLLNIAQYRDYCPNGVQVEGRRQISELVSGVTASMALLEAALDLKADAILVHHGYFWRGEDPCVVGIKRHRLQLLLKQGVNLLAYHLPLDAHPELGNNAQLANRLGLRGQACFGENQLGWLGRAESQIRSIAELAQLIENRLGRSPLVIGDPGQPLQQIGWCTGAAQGFFADAIAAGASAYISGEISEPTVHLARETGVAYLSAGHHATERYGVQALGAHLADHFGIHHTFVDIDNPV